MPTSVAKTILYKYSNYNKKSLSLYSEIVPKIQTDVERCKAVKTLFKGLTLLQRFNLLKDSAIQTDCRLLVAPL